MRTLIFVVTFLCLTPALQARQDSVSDEFDCRLNAARFPAFFTAVDKLQADLLQGVWSVENEQAEQSAFQFHDYGLVDIISTDVTGNLSVESMMWKLQERNGGVELILTDSEFNEQTIHLEATCDGLNATIMDSLDDIELILKPTISAKELDRMQNSLTGEWNSVTFPSDMADILSCNTDERAGITSMQLQFHKDGTYTKTCETPSARLEERGFYEITPDGQYIIFYAGNNQGTPSETYEASVVRVQYLTVGEMVLEQPVHAFGFAGIQHTAVRSIAYMQ